ncbi:hypothetical protein HanIR_Chr10g0490451 [Helianthus annuus]|nr:hypothetical protein HanIR_Chr10g0490451 [Helianthus annuus]
MIFHYHVFSFDRQRTFKENPNPRFMSLSKQGKHGLWFHSLLMEHHKEVPEGSLEGDARSKSYFQAIIHFIDSEYCDNKYDAG